MRRETSRAPRIVAPPSSSCGGVREGCYEGLCSEELGGGGGRLNIRIRYRYDRYNEKVFVENRNTNIQM